MFHLRFAYFINDYLFEWSSCQYVWMCIYPYAHMHLCPYAHMCEKYVKNIRLSVHVYMQMGVYITLFVCVCAYMYICVKVFMLMHVIFG